MVSEKARSGKNNCKIMIGGKNMSESVSKIVLMDFYAAWCGPCRLQDPIMEELKKKFDGKVEFKKIDVDKDYELASKYQVRAIPTIIIEMDGKILKKHVGVTSVKILEGNIKDILEKT